MATPKPIRILSVEDHPVFREGLRSIISSQPDMLLVAQATNAVEAVAEFRGVCFPVHPLAELVGRHSSILVDPFFARGLAIC